MLNQFPSAAATVAPERAAASFPVVASTPQSAAPWLLNAPATLAAKALPFAAPWVLATTGLSDVGATWPRLNAPTTSAAKALPFAAPWVPATAGLSDVGATWSRLDAPATSAAKALPFAAPWLLASTALPDVGALRLDLDTRRAGHRDAGPLLFGGRGHDARLLRSNGKVTPGRPVHRPQAVHHRPPATVADRPNDRRDGFAGDRDDVLIADGARFGVRVG